MLQALGSFQLTRTKVKHSKPAFQFYGGYYAQFFSNLFKTDSVQSSSNYLQKFFTKNLLTAR